MDRFGDGWMSKPAQDLCRIMFLFGNVDPVQLVRLLPHGGREKVNIRSVEKALAKLREVAA